MILMVREVNMRLPEGKQHVTCYTCHRGRVTPEIEPLGNSAQTRQGDQFDRVIGYL